MFINRQVDPLDVDETYIKVIIDSDRHITIRNNIREQIDVPWLY